MPPGRFGGPLVVSMRPFAARDVDTVTEVMRRLVRSHGAPLHAGDPAESRSDKWKVRRAVQHDARAPKLSASTNKAIPPSPPSPSSERLRIVYLCQALKMSFSRFVLWTARYYAIAKTTLRPIRLRTAANKAEVAVRRSWPLMRKTSAVRP